MVQSFLLLAAAGLAQAHFGIEYPPMRANTLGSSKNTTYSQWTNPCKPLHPSLLHQTKPNQKLQLMHRQAPVCPATSPARRSPPGP